MSSVNWLVEISNSPVEYYSLVETVDSSQAWDERLIGPPSIKKAVTAPGGGFVTLADTSVTFSNADGAISPWISGAKDPRGKQIRIFSKAMHNEADTRVIRFSGTIVNVSGSSSEQGLSDITVSASPDAEEFLRSMVPFLNTSRKLFEAAQPSGFGIATNSLVEESYDKVIPVVFGGTREHFPGILIERSNTVHDYLVCHDGRDVFCRANVNSAYRMDPLAGTPKVVLSNQYTSDQIAVEDEYADARSLQGFLVASFNSSQIGTVLFDVECNEFDTSRANVKRHWLFRDSIVDSKNSKVLLTGVAGNEEGAWTFATGGAEKDDSSVNVRHLAIHSGVDDNSNFDVSGFFFNEFDLPQTRASYKAGGASPNDDFQVDGVESFHIATRVKRQTGPFGDKLTGTLIYRYHTAQLEGYRCTFSNGLAKFLLTDGSETVAVSAVTNVDDGNWHDVVFNLDRVYDKAQIIIDNTVDVEVSVPGLGTLTPVSGQDAPMYVFEGRVAPDDVFYGQCDHINWHREPYGAVGIYTTGQSGQSDSALSIPTAEDFYETSPTDCNIAASTDFMLMAWFQTTNANTIICERIEGAVVDGFRIATVSGKAKVSIWDGSEKARTSSTSVDDDKWHQVWLVRESNVLKLYVDGVAEGGSQASSAEVWGAGDTGNITIDVDGNVDEVMLEIGSSLTAAQIRKQYMNSVGALGSVVQRVIENSSWGLNQATEVQVIDQTSFDAADDVFFDAARFADTLNPSHPIYVRVNGAVTVQVEAVELISELLRMYGGVIQKLTAGTWEFKYAWQKVNSLSHTLGHLDSVYNNVNRISGYRRTNIDEMPQRFACRYQKFNDPFLQAKVAHRDHQFISRTGWREVLSTGGLNALLLDLPYVRDWHSADRIADFVFDWTKADEELLLTLSALADVGNSKVAMDIEPGDVVELTQSQWGLSSKEYRVSEVGIANNDQVSLQCFENTSLADTYDEHPDGAISDLLPDSSPDYRYTYPLAPKNLEEVSQVAGEMGTYVGIRFDLVGGEINEDVVREVQILWGYDNLLDETQAEETDEGGEAVKIVSIPVTFERVRDGGTVIWATTDMEQGRNVYLRVRSVSTYGKESSYAQTLANPQETKLDIAVETVAGSARPNSTGGLVHGSSSTGIPGAAVAVKLIISAGAAKLTGFTGLLPFEPNITDPNEVFILLSNEVLERDTSSPPAYGKFYLSGTGNKDVEFYRDIEAEGPGDQDEMAIVIAVPC